MRTTGPQGRGIQPRRRTRSRRWVVGAGVGVVAVLLLGGVLVWTWLLPEHRPSLRAGERYGIDVASHQGEIDWRAVAGDGIDVAYVKATEGGDFTDERFAANWAGAGEAGLDRGAYHFFTLCRSGADQAAHFLATVEPDPEALAPAVDLELAGNCADRPSFSEVRAELLAFLDPVEAAWGRPVVLYVGDDWDRQYPTRADLDRPLWHRRILLRPDVGGWVIWQVHGYAHVAGIHGDTDLNVVRPTAS